MILSSKRNSGYGRDSEIWHRWTKCSKDKNNVSYTVFSVSLVSSSAMAEPVVSLADGVIKGRRRTDANGQEFLSFEGIPYGEPPVGELRFKDPVPVKPWDGIKECTKMGPGSLCMQPVTPEHPDYALGKRGFVLEGSEDCLNINVYTRQLKSSSGAPRPVMFYIHGGAYIMCNVHPYGPEKLMTQDVVLVHFHFRMGPFGFLAMEDPELDISGNAGMKDKILALKWVQKNIHHFNGDPKNVTIFGHSAGASSIHYLLVSPAASGLFHKAIVQSASALNNALRGTGSNAKALAKAISYEETDEKKILKYLQSLPPEKVVEAQLKVKETWQPCNMRLFSPVVESPGRKDPFLTVEPLELMRTGNYNHVPIMIGYSEMEGIDIMEIDPEAPVVVDVYKEENMTPVWFGFEKGSEEFKAIARKIMKFYFGDSEPEYISLPTVNWVSDIAIVRDVYNSTKIFAETCKEPVFFYRLCMPTPSEEKFASKNIHGASHGTELPYLFKMDDSKDEAKEAISQKLLKLWTNFARYGNPTCQKDEVISVYWIPVTKERMNYLSIGEDLVMKEKPDPERMAFWDEIYQSYPQTMYR